ncbi:hypothetical protein [Micromonospora sp. NPDC004704]
MFRTIRDWWTTRRSNPAKIKEESTELWRFSAPMGAADRHSPAWHSAPTAEYRPRIMTLGQLTGYRVVRSR